MPDPLPPLGLDDLRVAEPDRDSEEAFNPSETWAQACDAIERGYAADDVADLLLMLPDDEFNDLLGEKPEQVDAGSAEMQLCRMLALLHSDHWAPEISRASVYDLLDERDRLRAALLMIHKHAVQGVTDPRFAADQCHEIAEHTSKALEG